MPVFDFYPKRKRRESRAGQPDVYEYDKIPTPLRVQIIHIWKEVIGSGYDEYEPSSAPVRWQYIHDTVAREIGVFKLTDDEPFEVRCTRWFLHQADTDNALGIIELTFRLVERVVGEWSDYKREAEDIQVTPGAAIAELNERFREHGVGYQYESGYIIRVDSQYVHTEVVKSALALLHEKQFVKANEEFLGAHRHYREGNHKDCVVAAHRAFESTLRAICAIKKWDVQKGDGATELLKVVRAKGIFPDYLGKSFDTYLAMLKTGLPSVRNNAGGHGENPESPTVPPYIAAYALHMTATNIVMIVEAMKAMGKAEHRRR